MKMKKMAFEIVQGSATAPPRRSPRAIRPIGQPPRPFSPPRSRTGSYHRDLAALLGEGNIQNGYCRLCDLNEADANNLALRYRLDPSSGEAVREEAARLEAILGRSA
jgi:hypothetical protein